MTSSTTTLIWINQDGQALCGEHVDSTVRAAIDAYPEAACHVVIPDRLDLPFANRSRSSLSKAARVAQKQAIDRYVRKHGCSPDDLYDEWNALPLDESFCECCSPVDSGPMNATTDETLTFDQIRGMIGLKSSATRWLPFTGILEFEICRGTMQFQKTWNGESWTTENGLVWRHEDKTDGAITTGRIETRDDVAWWLDAFARKADACSDVLLEVSR